MMDRYMVNGSDRYQMLLKKFFWGSVWSDVADLVGGVVLGTRYLV